MNEVRYITDAQSIRKLLKEALIEAHQELNRNKPEKTYTINQARKLVGKSHYKVKQLVSSGIIPTTKDGLITESALNDYLRPNQ